MIKFNLPLSPNTTNLVRSFLIEKDHTKKNKI
jgi:hypothetical protein